MIADSGTYIAVAILLGLPFLGLVVYCRGAVALFAAPRSRIAQMILAAIIFTNIAVAVVGLTVGGSWDRLAPWCGLLLSAYLWARGALLLLHPSTPAENTHSDTANTA